MPPSYPVARPPHSGRTMLGGMVVMAGFFAMFWHNLERRQQKKDHVEKTTAGAYTAWSHRLMQFSEPAEGDLESLNSRAVRTLPRATLLLPPVREYDNKHSNLRDFFASADPSNEARRLQPAPQRGHTDGSHKVYTKAPDFVNSYEKTPKYWKIKKAPQDMEAALQADQV